MKLTPFKVKIKIGSHSFRWVLVYARTAAAARIKAMRQTKHIGSCVDVREVEKERAPFEAFA